MRGSGRPPLVMASSSRPVTGGTLSDRPHRPAARGHGDSTASSGRRRGAGRGSRQGAGVMRRLGGVEPGLTLCPQPSRVRSLAGAASGPGSGWRRPVSSSCAPPRSASSQRPVSSARAAADTRKVWAAGLTGCVGAHQPAVRGGSSATQPAASPEPACWPAFRRPRCCWRQQPTEVQRAQDASGEEFCPKTPLWRGRPLLRCSPRPRAGQVLWPLEGPGARRRAPIGVCGGRSHRAFGAEMQMTIPRERQNFLRRGNPASNQSGHPRGSPPLRAPL